MLAVIYGRVSTEEQYRTGFSLAEQMRACRQRAEELASGLAEALLVEAFTDDLSGDLLERPGLQAALALIRREPATCFICLDPDRLARRLMHQLLVTDEIERYDCRLEFVQHDYQETPEGRLFYQMRGAIAEFEKAKILERTARGQRGKVAAGGLPHAVRMYGYRFVKGAGKHAPARDVLVPDPYEANWVRQIYGWCAVEQIGPLRIARRLNELGVPTKTHSGRWQQTQVRRMLTHPTYATGLLALGKRDHRGLAVARRLTPQQRAEKGLTLTAASKPKAQWQYVTVDPLVSEALWHSVQAVLRRFRSGGQQSGRRDGPRPLSGLGRCGLCGGPLYYVNGSKIVCARRYASHWRGEASPSQGCSLPAKPRAAVELTVWQWVVGWLSEPGRIDKGLAQLTAERETAHPPPATEPAEVEILAQELRQREDERERLGLLFARGLWPVERALPAIEAVNRQIQAIQSRLDEAARQPTSGAAPPQSLYLSTLAHSELVTAVTTTLESLTEESKAELIRLAVHAFHLLPSARGAPPVIQVFPAE